MLRRLNEAVRARARGLLLFPVLACRNQWSRSSVVAEGTNVTVCLTTYGTRLAHVHLVIESIARGRLRPERLLLWLSHDEAGRQLTGGLRRLQQRGLEIRRCDDFGSHKKYYPFIADEGPGHGTLVTADDDVYYPRSWLLGFVQARDEDPGAMWCYRARRMVIVNGAPTPYRTWPLWVGTGPSPLMVPTGVSGTLHPPALMAEVRRRGEQFRSIAPAADDLWLHALAVDRHIPIRQVGARNWHFPVAPTAGGEPLMRRNFSQGNDEVVARLYGAELVQRIQHGAHEGTR